METSLGMLHPSGTSSLAGEQTALDLGLEPPLGKCACCGQSIRRGQGLTVRRSYRFGICLVSLHRACRSEIGDQGVLEIVRQREDGIARRLGLDGS